MRGQWHEARWIEAKNNSGYDIPAFGLVKIAGADWESPNRTVLLVERPGEDSDYPCAINSYKPIADGDYGLVTLEGPAWVTYDTAGTPAAGNEWGAAADSFLLTADNTGFTVLGGVDATREIVLVNFTAMSKVLIITFRLYDDLSVNDEVVHGTIFEQEGPGIKHTCTGAGAIHLHNMPSVATGHYEFYGDSGDYGRAAWMYGDHFKILIVECP